MPKRFGYSRINTIGCIALFVVVLVSVTLFLVNIASTVLTYQVTKALVSMATFHVRIDGVTMEPTLQRDSIVLVNKLAYEQQTPKRGDIVVYKPPTAPTRMFIHRVIGLPEEKVQIREGKVIINGVTLSESHIETLPNYRGEWTLNSGEYFVLGDNRTNSLDSHIWGALPAGNILGRAELVYWPLGRWKSLSETSYIP